MFLAFVRGEVVKEACVVTHAVWREIQPRVGHVHAHVDALDFSLAVIAGCGEVFCHVFFLPFGAPVGAHGTLSKGMNARGARASEPCSVSTHGNAVEAGGILLPRSPERRV